MPALFFQIMTISRQGLIVVLGWMVWNNSDDSTELNSDVLGNNRYQKGLKHKGLGPCSIPSIYCVMYY